MVRQITAGLVGSMTRLQLGTRRFSSSKKFWTTLIRGGPAPSVCATGFIVFTTIGPLVVPVAERLVHAYPLGPMITMAVGAVPTRIVAMTMLSASLITDTSLESRLVT